jgi:AraC-like DNA-binding protein
VSEPTLSIRLVWPFIRLMADLQTELAVLREAGIDIGRLADPDLRIPHRLVVKLLSASVEKTGDAALGLHAGDLLEPGDFGPMEYAARSCRDLRTAIECNMRYMRVLDDAMDATLTERGDTAVWKLAYGVISAHPAINDFAVAASLTLGRRYTGIDGAPLEVHLTHAEPTSAAEYERVFRAPVKLGAAENAIVFRRRALDVPLAQANPDLYRAFAAQAERLLESLPQTVGITREVREQVIDRLRRHDVEMAAIARDLHMSVATLRRRLAEEGTTHREVVDEVRHTLALRHIEGGSLAVSEIAFLLGFSNVSAFSKAFRRWTGTSPLEFRSRLRAAR